MFACGDLQKPAVSESAALDGAAATLSSLCLVHCLLLPLLGVLLPALPAGSVLHGPVWLHWLLIGTALPFSIYALWRGLESHGSRWPLLLAVAGFLVMMAGALLHDGGLAEPGLTVGGGLLVALAHWRNWMARPA